MELSTKTLRIRGLFSPLRFNEGDNLLDTLNANKVSISQSCDGNGSCTTCRVLVHPLSATGARTEIESERALERAFAENERLSCQTILLSDLEIEILNSEEE